MKRQERRGAKGESDLLETTRPEEQRLESEQQPVAPRQIRRTLVATPQDDELLLEQEVLRHHCAHITGPQSFAIVTARLNRVNTKSFMVNERRPDAGRHATLPNPEFGAKILNSETHTVRIGKHCPLFRKFFRTLL